MNVRRLIGTLVCASMVIVLLCGCGSKEHATPFDGMLDIDTNKIYRLGDSKAKFDEDFGFGEFDADKDRYSYLSDNLHVTYDENDNASEIMVDGTTNRFEFYNFTFSTDIASIEGRYERKDVAGYHFYSLYFDKNGDICKLSKAAVTAQLMVRDGDLLDMKDGQYLHYSIEARTPW